MKAVLQKNSGLKLIDVNDEVVSHLNNPHQVLPQDMTEAASSNHIVTIGVFLEHVLGSALRLRKALIKPPAGSMKAQDLPDYTHQRKPDVERRQFKKNVLFVNQPEEPTQTARCEQGYYTADCQPN